MVVFQDGIPKKAHYRKFAVRGLDGQDDFAAMAEVVSRRFARLRTGTEDEYDEGFATAPNLVVIDGGKGQLSAALAAMQAYELPRVAVISLAKRVEEIFVPQQSDPILLDPHSAGLQLLQRVRDEAHRFALGFHRQRRSARSRESLFDTLEGVGPVRRRALLRHSARRRPWSRRPGGARGRAGSPGEDGARDLCAAAQDRRRLGLSELHLHEFPLAAVRRVHEDADRGEARPPVDRDRPTVEGCHAEDERAGANSDRA